MIQTKYGNVINPLDFKAEDITVEELAHALACQNRFFGHARFPISVAQHAVSVSYLAVGHEMQALHHDDSEALLGDINKWLKQADCFRDYRLLEEYVQTEFYQKFNCNPRTNTIVVEADRLAVRCEMVYAFGRHYKEIGPGYGPPTPAELNFFVKKTGFKEMMPWWQAENLYIERHNFLADTTYSISLGD